MNVSIKSVELPLKVLWKLSRNETNHKTNFVIEIESASNVFRGEVAPNIRYDETPEKIVSQFESLDFSSINNFKELDAYLESKDLCKSLEYGIESAFVHFYANEKNQNVSEFLELTQVDTVPTSVSIPIMEPGSVEEYLKKFDTHEFYKLKVDHDSAPELIKETLRCIGDKILRIDANEGWSDLDDLVKLLNNFAGKNIQFVEQPFDAKMNDEYFELYKRSPFPIMADESIIDSADFNDLSRQFHWVNIKLMKTGSYYKAIELLNAAKSHGMKCMIGCMIETSIGIESALNLASLGDAFDLDGALLIKQDPYNYISYKNGNVVRRNS